MKEYFVLLYTWDSPEGKRGEFLGRKNKHKSSLLSDLTALFESYSKNTVLYGWKTAKKAEPYYSLAKLRYMDAQLILVDVCATPATMEIV